MKNRFTYAIPIILVIIVCYAAILLLPRLSRTTDTINYAELGNKYFLEHDYDKALASYEQAMQAGYKSLDIFYNSGWIYYRKKNNYKMAEELFKKGLLYYPYDSTLHDTLSQVYFKTGNFSAGMDQYKLAVAYGKGVIVKINMNRAAELLKNQGKSDKEIYDFFLGIIKFNPKDTNAIYQAAEYDQKEGRFQDALDKFKKIVKLEPRMKKHLALDMGVCYFYLKDYRTALEYFRKAQKAGDIVPEIFINKAKENVTAQ